jgi:hypothetical protein
MRRRNVIIMSGLALLGLACDPEPGAKEGPNTKCKAGTPGCANQDDDDEERRYLITVKASSIARGLINADVMINHNARGEWMRQPMKRQMPLQAPGWQDTVQAPASRRWEVQVIAPKVSPDRGGEILLAVKIEILGGRQDGQTVGANAKHTGGELVCVKEAGR